MNPKRVTLIVLGTLLLAAPAYLAAQQDQGQQESVADAARKAQAEKKNAPKAKMTIDDDNVGTLTGTVNVVGQQPASDDQAKKTSAAAAPGDKATKKDESYFRDKFSTANKKLADDQRDLDVTQREYNLKQQQFYTDPMASLKQDYSRQDLNDTKTKIDDLTAKVAQDKADIASIEDELRQAGGDPGWESQPPQSSATSGSTSASADSGAEQPASPPATSSAPQQ